MGAFSSVPRAKIHLFGLDGGGKTTIVLNLKFNEAVQTVSSVGVLVEELDPIENVAVSLFDVSRNFQRLFYEVYSLVSFLILVMGDSLGGIKHHCKS